jgi:hypothetical protein
VAASSNLRLVGDTPHWAKSSKVFIPSQLVLDFYGKPFILNGLICKVQIQKGIKRYAKDEAPVIAGAFFFYLKSIIAARGKLIGHAFVLDWRGFGGLRG